MSSPKAGATLMAVTALACILMLVLPGRTVTTAYINDLLIFLDGAHRIGWGQVPNRDFHSSLGPLAYYIPASGYWLTGSFGGAMPAGMAAFIALFAGIAAHVLTSRLRDVLALPVFGFLLLLLAAPVNIGDGLSALSFAMYYNRIGWAALALLVIMYLRPTRPHSRQTWLDLGAATILVLVQFYTKATYGVVAFAFLVFMLTDRRQRGWAAGALALTVLAAMLIELFWRGSWAYVQDLRQTARISGGNEIARALFAILPNLADLTVFGIVAALALWRRFLRRDLLLYVFCVTAGLLIVSQNAQGSGVFTLHAGAAVASQRLLSTVGRARSGRQAGSTAILAGGAPLLMLFMLLPRTVHHACALVLHVGLAVGDAGRPFGLPAFEDVHVARLWSPGDHGFTGMYVDTFASGASVLRAASVPLERVLVLDFANPFSAGLGLTPPKGDNAWMHWGRNISDQDHIPPERLFADVAIVMEPKLGINAVPLRKLYGPYIDANFDAATENDRWTLFVKRDGRE